MTKLTNNRHRTWHLGVLLGLCTALPGQLLAADESHQTIRETAENYVLDQADRFTVSPELIVGELDSRLKLARCSQPLEAYESPNGLKGGRNVVGVRCSGNKPWKIYVPVRIALYEQVVVSTRSLAKGQTLEAADLQLVKKDTAKLRRAFYSDPVELVGMQLRRPIRRNRLISPAMLTQAKLIKRGSEVLIRARVGGLSAQMKGKALADGGKGERIKVKNLSSGRIITGTVVGSGVVQVMN